MLIKVRTAISFAVWVKKRRGHRGVHGGASDILDLDAWCSGENTHSHLVSLHRLLPTTEPWPSPWAASLSGIFQPLPPAEGHLQHSYDPLHCFRVVPLHLAPPLLSLLPLPVSRNFPAQQGWPHCSPSPMPSFIKIPSKSSPGPTLPPSLLPTHCPHCRWRAAFPFFQSLKHFSPPSWHTLFPHPHQTTLPLLQTQHTYHFIRKALSTAITPTPSLPMLLRAVVIM